MQNRVPTYTWKSKREKKKEPFGLPLPLDQNRILITFWLNARNKRIYDVFFPFLLLNCKKKKKKNMQGVWKNQLKRPSGKRKNASTFHSVGHFIFIHSNKFRNTRTSKAKKWTEWRIDYKEEKNYKNLDSKLSSLIEKIK